MQAWQIIVASAVAASVAAAALFLPGAVRSPTAAASLFQTYWPGVTVVWLGVYSVAALLLSTAAAVRELGDTASGQIGLDWPRRYLLRLGITQYISAVLVLLALGLLPIGYLDRAVFRGPRGNQLVARPGRLRRSDPCRGARLAHRDRCGRIAYPRVLGGFSGRS